MSGEQAPNTPGAADAARPAPSTAGGMLRAAREAAGMTLDTAAQQLKLAPRQVTALEEGDFASLPGRTFVRGFLRNYARLVHVDHVSIAKSGRALRERDPERVRWQRLGLEDCGSGEVGGEDGWWLVVRGWWIQRMAVAVGDRCRQNHFAERV